MKLSESTEIVKLSEMAEEDCIDLYSAFETVYWPGITSDILNTVPNCCPCAERLPSNQKETLRIDPRPKRACEQAATDLFDHTGKAYIVYARQVCVFTCGVLHQHWQRLSYS